MRKMVHDIIDRIYPAVACFCVMALQIDNTAQRTIVRHSPEDHSAAAGQRTTVQWQGRAGHMQRLVGGYSLRNRIGSFLS